MTYESIFGNKALATTIDQHIIKRMKTYAQFCELCGVDVTDGVDFYSILVQRTNDLRRQGTISQERVEKVLRYLNADGYDTDFLKYTNGNIPTTSNGAAAQKATTMQTKTIHTVNGQDVTKMNLDQKLAVLKDAENRLKELKGITTESKLVAKEIEKVTQFIADVNTLFDADVDA